MEPLSRAAAWKTIRKNLIVGIGVMVLGLGCLAAAVMFRSAIGHFVDSVATAQGTVIELVPAGPGKSPVVRLTTPAGRSITFRGSNISNPPAYHQCETVTVLFDPRAPDHGPKIESASEVWAPFIVFLLMGLLFTGVGLVVVVGHLRAGRKRPTCVPHARGHHQRPVGRPGAGQSGSPGGRQRHRRRRDRSAGALRQPGGGGLGGSGPDGARDHARDDRSGCAGYSAIVVLKSPPTAPPGHGVGQLQPLHEHRGGLHQQRPVRGGIPVHPPRLRHDPWRVQGGCRDLDALRRSGPHDLRHLVPRPGRHPFLRRRSRLHEALGQQQRSAQPERPGHGHHVPHHPVGQRRRLWQLLDRPPERPLPGLGRGRPPAGHDPGPGLVSGRGCSGRRSDVGLDAAPVDAGPTADAAQPDLPQSSDGPVPDMPASDLPSTHDAAKHAAAPHDAATHDATTR